MLAVARATCVSFGSLLYSPLWYLTRNYKTSMFVSWRTRVLWLPDPVDICGQFQCYLRRSFPVVDHESVLDSNTNALNPNASQSQTSLVRLLWLWRHLDTRNFSLVTAAAVSVCLFIVCLSATSLSVAHEFQGLYTGDAKPPAGSRGELDMHETGKSWPKGLIRTFSFVGATVPNNGRAGSCLVCDSSFPKRGQLKHNLQLEY